MLFIDYLLRPENAMKNINYLYYPFPVKDARRDASTTWPRTCRPATSSVEDLENPDVFRLLRRRRGPARAPPCGPK